MCAPLACASRDARSSVVSPATFSARAYHLRLQMRQPSTSNRIRIIVADDHVTVREGLAAIIGRQPDMQPPRTAKYYEDSHS